MQLGDVLIEVVMKKKILAIEELTREQLRNAVGGKDSDPNSPHKTATRRDDGKKDEQAGDVPCDMAVANPDSTGNK